MVFLIGFAIVLVPMAMTSFIWLLTKRLPLGIRWATSLSFSSLPILLPASEIVRLEYVPGDPDVLLAFAFLGAVALGASAISLAVLQLLNIGEAR